MTTKHLTKELQRASTATWMTNFELNLAATDYEEALAKLTDAKVHFAEMKKVWKTANQADIAADEAYMDAQKALNEA